MRAVVICSNQQYASSLDPFPPVGSIGEVIEGPDVFNEYEIIFEDYPPPTFLDSAWTCHRSMIAFFDEKLGSTASSSTNDDMEKAGAQP